MPILSNGQVVGISSERARYHATRMGVRVSRQTPHRDLYQLVDIVFAHHKDSPSSWKSCYQFSGHTLADQDWMNGLAEVDRDSLLQWLQASHTRYEIEGARRKLIYDDLPAAIISHPYPDQLYSGLYKTILAMPATCMTPGQWQRTLLNLQQHAIRRDELDWSGVMAFLAKAEQLPDKKISTEDLLASIDFSNIRMELSNELVSLNQNNTHAHFRARYRYMSLFGGEDYREWLLCLPDYQQSLFGAHFTERNVLLHLRTKTRYDTRGRKLLFIEELQSDWHQVSIKNKFSRSRTHVPLAPFRKEWVSLGLKLMLLHAVKEGFDGLAWADGNIQATRYRSDIPSIRRIYDKEIQTHLLSLARHWHAGITRTEFVTKAPALQIKPLRGPRRRENPHECIKRSVYDRQGNLSILEHYTKTVRLPLPAFIMPAGMVEHIKKEGLPLFGNHIFQDCL